MKIESDNMEVSSIQVKTYEPFEIKKAGKISFQMEDCVGLTL